MKNIKSLKIAVLAINGFILCSTSIIAQENTVIEDDQAVPVFEDGEAQIVPAFSDPDKWIKEDLWVETEFDSDGDGKPDRMHVDVTTSAYYIRFKRF